MGVDFKINEIGLYQVFKHTWKYCFNSAHGSCPDVDSIFFNCCIVLRAALTGVTGVSILDVVAVDGDLTNRQMNFIRLS